LDLPTDGIPAACNLSLLIRTAAFIMFFMCFHGITSSPLIQQANGYPVRYLSTAAAFVLFVGVPVILMIFVAFTTDRPYRKALDKETTLQIMAEDAGKHFDPHLLALFKSYF
jgi:hypothetical protein